MPYGYKSLFNTEQQSRLFGIYIRLEREKQNISVIKLANIVGIASSYLSEIEKGKKTPTDITLISLCDALNINFDYKYYDSNIENKLKDLYHYCLFIKNIQEVEKCFSQLNTAKNRSSFLYPYGILGEKIKDFYIFHNELNIEDLELLYELAELMENSFFKVAVLDLEACFKRIKSTNSLIDDFYRSSEKFFATNLTDYDSIRSYFSGIYALHASDFYNSEKNIIKASEYCKIAEKFLGISISLTELLKVKELSIKIEIASGNYKYALQQLFSLMKVIVDPIDKGACLELIGITYFLTHDYKAAADAFHEALQMNPNNILSSYYLLLLSISYLSKDNIENYHTDIQQNQQLYSVFKAVQEDADVCNTFNNFIENIEDQNIKKLYYEWIFQYACDKEDYKKATYYAKKIILISKSAY